MTTHEVASLFLNFLDASLSLAILSYFCRSESTAHPHEFEQQRDERIYKEVGAALAYSSSSYDQALDYQWMNIDGKATGNSAHDMFNRGIRRLRHEYSRHHSTLLIPYSNAHKNVGYTTQHLYHASRDDEMNSSRNVTTVDLLRNYMHTGKRIGGPMEVRMKWGFSDLQARVYYALGGDAYFSALYIKPICNKICEILPSTNPFSRFDVKRIHVISPDEVVVTYDYTAFTTSLQELKSFLFYLAEQLDGVYVDAIDPFDGIIQLHLRDYLHQYNDRINLHQAFQLNRIYTANHNMDENATFYQGRNGSLGSQGNIVFSTTLHGIHLSDFTGTPWEDSCVGDDALAAIIADLLPLFIDHVNKLGTIHPEKFTTLKGDKEDVTLAARQQFKYLKRPITVDFVGFIRSGTLEAFPDIFSALQFETDPFRDSNSSTPEQLIKALVTQWGRFLNIFTADQVGLSYTLEDHLFLLLEMIGVAYDDFGIPREGLLPGTVFGKGDNRVEAAFYAPPCDDLDVFRENWMDLLFRRFENDRIVVPFVTESMVGPDPESLATLFTRSSAGHPFISMSVALGFGRYEIILTETSFSEDIFRREFDRVFAGKGHVLANVEFFDTPVWFEEALMYFLDDVGLGDPFEALSDINTVLSN